MSKKRNLTNTMILWNEHNSPPIILGDWPGEGRYKGWRYSLGACDTSIQKENIEKRAWHLAENVMNIFKNYEVYKITFEEIMETIRPLEEYKRMRFTADEAVEVVRQNSANNSTS